MIAAVVPNLDKLETERCTRTLIAKMDALGAPVLMQKEMRAVFEDPRVRFVDSEEELYRQGDVLIAVGGDGTIIQVAKGAAQYGKAVLGINVGRLGFVATLERHELDQLEKLVQGAYTVEKRMMLDVSIGGEERHYSVLNDAVLQVGLALLIACQRVNGLGDFLLADARRCAAPVPHAKSAYQGRVLVGRQQRGGGLRVYGVPALNAGNAVDGHLAAMLLFLPEKCHD